MSKLNSTLILFALSLSSFAQTKQERLKIFWPEEYKWKTISNIEDSSAAFIQFIPEKENVSNWTISGSLRTTKKLVAPNLDLIIQSYTRSALKESSKAKITVIERNDSTKNIWVLLKVETSDFPNDPVPESDFWYIQQGDLNHFAAFVGIREKEFSKSFIEKWSKIFKMSKIIYE